MSGGRPAEEQAVHEAYGSPRVESDREKLYRWLSALQRPRVRWLVLAAALLLASPSLFTGFVADDYVLEYELHGPEDNEWAGEPPWDLYRLLDPEHVARMRDGNGAPWWFYERAFCRFMRPLSGLTHLLDDRLAPRSALVAHLHSLLWLGLLLWTVTWAYRSIIRQPWVAAVSGAMFALDAGHGATLSWIVNRSSFIAAVFGVTALGLHHRYRRDRAVGDGVLACLSLLIGLFCAELTLGVVGYLAAYACFMERGSMLRRAGSLWPYAPVVLVWLIVREAGGYGTEGWNVYVDPLREPWLFVKLLPARAMLLLASQSTRLSADIHDLLAPAQRPWYLLVAIGCCGLLVYFLWPLLGPRRAAGDDSVRSGESNDTTAEARFWAAGAAAAVVPVCAAQPSDRLLTLVGLGVMPVLGHALHGVLTRASSAGPRLKLAGVYSALHLIISPLLLPVMSMGAGIVGAVIARVESSLPRDPGIVDQTVVVASVPDSLLTGFLQIMRSLNDRPRPRRLYWLVATREPVLFERTGDTTLRVTPRRGFYDQPQESRARQHPLPLGAQVDLSDLSAQVLALTDDGRPATVGFTFQQPLRASQYVWLTWRDGQLVPWSLPRVGETTTLPAVADP